MSHDLMPPENSPALSAVIAAYLEAVDAGQRPDRAELLARHTELADQLREFFTTQDQLEEVAGPLRQASPPGAETVAPGGQDRRVSLAQIHRGICDWLRWQAAKELLLHELMTVQERVPA